MDVPTWAGDGEGEQLSATRDAGVPRARSPVEDGSRVVLSPVVRNGLRWPTVLRRSAITMDVAVIATITAVVVLVLWGDQHAANRAMLVCALIGAALLVAALPLARAWDVSVLGTGSAEFRRIGNATVGAVVVLALGGLVFLVSSVRIWVFVLVPLTGVAVAGGRFLLRKRLHRARARGRCTFPVLAVGNAEAVADLIMRSRRDPYFGWHIVGACTPTQTGVTETSSILGVDVVGDLDSVGRLASEGGYSIVAVTKAHGWGPGRLQRLAWELECTDAELVVDPGLMEIAGPRLHITPMDGMPVLRLSRPRFTGLARLLKASMDRAVAALLLVLVAPVFVAIAIAITLEDRGAVFYRQERIGANGRSFQMIKFRSMVTDADRRRAALLRANEVEGGTLFKIARDPRVTRIGTTLRRYSIDELPQLLNVLGGSMSLVGPRPPLPEEVATYAAAARRRLLVRPGMTGLWQVSGRSDLSWEESVRLDLRYVENWSPALDLTILWKTIGAVLTGRGAY
ncbi:sugar transferase [Pseudonocardia pini]|uniref:sugar transferase n=1 Tax=Pseudonocardia pini TaxID=2758030 RepID=UPI001FE49299|nr:sugar transferase [Pseudonocardia pini]